MNWATFFTVLGIALLMLAYIYTDMAFKPSQILPMGLYLIAVSLLAFAAANVN